MLKSTIVIHVFRMILMFYTTLNLRCIGESLKDARHLAGLKNICASLSYNCMVVDDNEIVVYTIVYIFLISNPVSRYSIL